MNDSTSESKLYKILLCCIHHLKEKEMEPVVALASSSEKWNLET